MLYVQVPLMDIAGRRILLLIPMLVMIVDLAVLTACLITQVLLKTFVTLSKHTVRSALKLSLQQLLQIIKQTECVGW